VAFTENFVYPPNRDCGLYTNPKKFATDAFVNTTYDTGALVANENLFDGGDVTVTPPPVNHDVLFEYASAPERVSVKSTVPFDAKAYI
jgi:hypothetical protein